MAFNPDRIQVWINQRCKVGDGWDYTSRLYADWKQWIEAPERRGEAGTVKAFAQALKARGFEQRRDGRGNGFYRIWIKRPRYGA